VADGIHHNVRFNDNEGRTKDEKYQYLPVLMGATADGRTVKKSQPNSKCCISHDLRYAGFSHLSRLISSWQ
jgi:hypothetical protein